MVFAVAVLLVLMYFSMGHMWGAPMPRWLHHNTVPSTPIEFVSRLTAHEVTPGTAETAFSTRAEHAAQLMPVTLYCFISSSLLYAKQFIRMKLISS